MSTDFRILKEETVPYKGGKLYLMLLRENARFGVEVVNREKTFGRKYASTRKEADKLFDLITDKLFKYKLIVDAENAIARCFSVDSNDKFIFVLVADDTILTQADISPLKEKVEFRTRIKLGYNKNKREKNALTIYIYLGSRLTSNQKAFGVLVGTRKAKDLKFELL